MTETAELLRQISTEKLSCPVPVKLQPRLARYVREKGGSTFVRSVLINSLEREIYGRTTNE